MKPIVFLALALTLVPARAQTACCQPHAGPGCSDPDCAAAVCALDPFCCSSAWDTRCVAEASVTCASCRPAAACNPPTAQFVEIEPCGASVDDPCGALAGSPRSLPLDTVASGSVWATESSRDVDWFEVHLPTPARLRVELWTTGPIGAVIVDAACPPTVHAESVDGCPSACEACLPAGIWRIAVRPLLFEPMPCGDPLGTYRLRARVEACQPAMPANDRCDAATIASLGVIAFDTSNATTEPAWLPPMCDEGSGLALTNDIWFDFTAPESADYTISTCGLADYDARLALYDQCGGSVLACNDDACEDGGASMTIGLACGQRVLLRVGGWGHGASGAIQISSNFGQGCDCPGDLDGNGEVDASDAALLLLCYGDTGGAADVDGDGEVGSADLGLLLLMNGPCS